jgi:hypothetical protein
VENRRGISRSSRGAGKGDDRSLVICFILTETHILITYCINAHTVLGNEVIYISNFLSENILNVLSLHIIKVGEVKTALISL